MLQSLKILIAFILTVILSVVLTPFFGGLYDKFFPGGYFFWGPPHPEYIPGFIVAYMFSLPLFFLSLLEKKKPMWLLIGLSPIILLNLWAPDGGELIMDIVAFITGSVLGLLATKLSKLGEKNLKS